MSIKIQQFLSWSALEGKHFPVLEVLRTFQQGSEEIVVIGGTFADGNDRWETPNKGFILNRRVWERAHSQIPDREREDARRHILKKFRAVAKLTSSPPERINNPLEPLQGLLFAD